MLSEQDRSRFQHPRSWLVSSLIHGFANESSASPGPKHLTRLSLLDRQKGPPH